MAVVAGSIAPVQADTLVVNQSTNCTGGASYHTTINDALGNASQGDVIEVCQGTYNENIDILEQVELRGFPRNASKVIINATTSADRVIHVKNDSVNISFLTVMNVTQAGIYYNGTTGTGNCSNNRFTMVNKGLDIVNRDGLTVTNNVFIMDNSTATGVDMFGGVNNTIISGNIFTGEMNQNYDYVIGIFDDSVNITISNNSIHTANNSDVFFNEMGNINIIFYNNTVNITGGHYFGVDGNQGDHGPADLNTTHIGNYWGRWNGTGYSDTCTDSDADNICDVPYSLNASAGYIDYFPRTIYTAPVPSPPPFSSLTALLTSLRTVIDAVIGIVPAIITLIAYVAVGTFVGVTIAKITEKMKGV
jgi:hypothetical protein